MNGAVNLFVRHFVVVSIVSMLVYANSAYADRDLFVCDSYNRYLRQYDGTTGAYVGNFADLNYMADPVGVTADPRGIVLGSDNNFYLCGYNAGKNVVRVNGQTGAVDAFATGGGMNLPFDLAFGPDGYLYVLDLTAGILRFDATTGAYIDLFTKPSNLTYCRSLNFGSDGLLYMEVDLTAATILRYDPVTKTSLGVFASHSSFHGSSDFVFGPDGNIYATDDNSDNVARFNGATGAYMGVFTSGFALNSPTYLTFGPDGDLYVIHDAGAPESIVRYDGDTGAFIGTFVSAGSGGLDNPMGIVFGAEPVPEPGVMLLFGFGLFYVWRKKSR